MTIAELLAGIHSLETQHDLDAVFEAYKSRSKALRSVRAAAITLGNKVTIANITPKSLNGLTGVVTALGSGTYATVTLDPESTDKLRWGRTSRFVIGPDETEYPLKGIPKSCLIPV
jgi:hypothetical protein